MLRLSLFSKILLWFWISLLVLLLFLIAAFSLQMRLPLSSPFALAINGKLQDLERRIAIDLSDTPRYSWDTILNDYGRMYDVNFWLVSLDGQTISGDPAFMPDKVLQEVRGRYKTTLSPEIKPTPQIPSPQEPNAPPALYEAGPDGSGRSTTGRVRALPPQSASANSIFYMKAGDPALYWVGLRTLVFSGANRPMHAVLVVASDSMTGHGLFFAVYPWLFVFGIIVVLAALLWIPFVRRLTARVRRMMTAAEEIGRGNFDVQMDNRGSDELTRLGEAIHRMSRKLDAFVHGQKRFLGDIAHELGSPIARMQIALSIMEQRLDGDERERIIDIQEDATELSALVDELLAFTRADLKTKPAPLDDVSLADVATRVLAREGRADVQIQTDIPDDITAIANADLLTRALSNLVRNAIRYAADAGPIRISADSLQDSVNLRVCDEGPGVPESDFERLFEPFYRVENSRSRDTGGHGLGLAIVATCVQACEGDVSAENRPGGGFCVTIRLKREI